MFAADGWLDGDGVDAGPTTTNVQDTVYRADGTAASGTLLISWPAFTTAGGQPVAAGSTSVKLGAGGALSVGLAPNAGASPSGSYYTVVYQLSEPVKHDGSADKAETDLVLPSVQPPLTKAPPTLNQQVNIYQRPKSALDKLTGDQIFELSKQMMNQMDVSDQRAYDFAVHDAAKAASGRRLAIIC